jgi:hypothetical protein
MRGGGSFGRRLALVVAALGAAGALAGTASFALFTSAATQETDTFAAGTVILGQTTELPPCVFTDGGTASQDAQGNITEISNPMEPGDTGKCVYDLKYSGSLNAWVALRLSLYTTAIAAYTPPGSLTQIGGEALMTDNPNGTADDQNGMTLSLTAAVTDGQTGTTGAVQTLPLQPIECITFLGSGNQEGVPGWHEYCETQRAPTLYVMVPDNANPGSTQNANADPAGSWTPGTTAVVTVTGSLPRTAGNAYQGSSLTITLGGVAVQASNNPLQNGLPQSGFGGS